MGIMSPGRLVLASLSILTLAVAVSAVLVNHTIDDQSTLSPTFFTYIPSEGSWSAGQTCMTCPIHPGIINSTQVYDGTWTYTIYDPGDTRSIQATFNGTAVYVYNVLANRVPGAATFMNLSFSIDGIYRGQFIHIPDSSTTVLYNVAELFACDVRLSRLHHGRTGSPILKCDFNDPDRIFAYILAHIPNLLASATLNICVAIRLTELRWIPEDRLWDHPSASSNPDEKDLETEGWSEPQHHSLHSLTLRRLDHLHTRKHRVVRKTWSIRGR
ncbi:hypothetical protein ONZ51_g8585 [Trametes cubensis]|uniref:Uncharacterized protein n=1 Tax=Trametes cubensis TaxID=1111947 RepID=A0AAD7TNF0_9APHY|nr:hypothetical protein ONZ51_g8585 [Trametes cubensis]